MIAWWSAFVVTQLAETPVYAASQRPGRAWSSALGWGLLPSAVTHPVLWATWGWWPAGLDPFTQVLWAESIVVAAEGAVWSRFHGRSLAWGLRVSLLANGLSVLVGEGLRAWVGWP